MKQTLRDKDGNVLWTNDPPERPDSKSSVPRASHHRFRTSLESPTETPKTPEERAQEREDLQALKRFTGGRRPKGDR